MRTHLDLDRARLRQPLDRARGVLRDLQMIAATEQRADFTLADVGIGGHEATDHVRTHLDLDRARLRQPLK